MDEESTASVALSTLVEHAAAESPAVVASTSQSTHYIKDGIDARVNASVAIPHVVIDDVTSSVNATFAVIHTSISRVKTDEINLRQDVSIVERLSWLTDIIQNYDGTDQRISIRLKPRREISVDATILNDAEYKALYDAYYNGAGNPVRIPVWGYSAVAKRRAPSGSVRIYCNPARGAFRSGDQVMIHARDGSIHLRRVEATFDDGIIIGRSIDVDVDPGACIVSSIKGYFSEAPSFSMNSISGSSSLTIRAERPRDQEAWPGRDITLPTYDGYVIVDRRPTSSDAGHTFDKNVEVIDNETGLERYITAWKQTYVEGPREYLVNKLWGYEDLQFWLTLFDYCCGRQKAFLTPTYREDLKPVSLSTVGIVVEGDVYDSLYKNSNTYRRLQIETEAGTVNVKSDAVSVNDEGNTVITFTSPISSAISQSEVKRVSYLTLVRLGSDSVTITHENTLATIGLSLRTATE